MHAADVPTLAVGPGASAQRKFEGLHRRRSERINARWGRLAPVVNALIDDPQSTTAWAKGSDGEQRLAAHLSRVLGDRAILLHDRKVPHSQANIDHLAVASSGVWVIDAKNYTGKVERRDKGGWFRTDERLYVGGRDRTRLVEGLKGQVAVVQGASGRGDVTVHPALCFTDATWGLFSKPFQLSGVWVTWANSLAELVVAPGPLDDDAVQEIATRISALLQPV